MSLETLPTQSTPTKTETSTLKLNCENLCCSLQTTSFKREDDNFMTDLAPIDVRTKTFQLKVPLEVGQAREVTSNQVHCHI